MTPGTYEHGFILVVDKVFQPPPDHSVAQTWDLINIYNEIWKHYSSYIIYHYSLYMKKVDQVSQPPPDHSVEQTWGDEKQTLDDDASV